MFELFGIASDTRPAAAVRADAFAAPSSGPRFVVTANLDRLRNLSRTPVLRAVFASAAARTLDGMPVMWLKLARDTAQGAERALTTRGTRLSGGNLRRRYPGCGRRATAVWLGGDAARGARRAVALRPLALTPTYALFHMLVAVPATGLA